MTTGQFLSSSWPLRPAVVAAAAALTLLFVVRQVRRRKMAVNDAVDARARAGQNGRLALALVGAVIFWIALDSPLSVLADQYLFSAHMLQHILLLLVIPPLLLLAWGKSGPATRIDSPQLQPSEPDSIIPNAVSSSSSSSSCSCSCSCSSSSSPNELRIRARARASSARQFMKTVFSTPLLAWAAGVGAMWFWHIPTMCDAAASSRALGAVQAISLMALGTWFWLPIVGPNLRRRIPPLLGVLYLFTACVGCTLLGIWITFAPASVCPVFLHPADPRGVLALIRNGWGISPTMDQQIGGLLMWVPACSIYLCGMIGLLTRWYAGAEIEPGHLAGAAAEARTA